LVYRTVSLLTTLSDLLEVTSGHFSYVKPFESQRRENKEYVAPTKLFTTSRSRTCRATLPTKTRRRSNGQTNRWSVVELDERRTTRSGQLSNISHQTRSQSHCYSMNYTTGSTVRHRRSDRRVVSALPLTSRWFLAGTHSSPDNLHLPTANSVNR